MAVATVISTNEITHLAEAPWGVDASPKTRASAA